MLHQAKVEQGLTCLCIKATFYFHDIHELTQREEGRKGRSWATGSIFLHLEIQTMERRRKERKNQSQTVLYIEVGASEESGCGTHTVSSLCLELF